MNRIIHIDDRGYCLVALEDGGYRAGCRRFSSAEEAVRHWGSSHYPDRMRGRLFLNAIERHLLGESKVLEIPDGLRDLSLDGGALPDGTVLPAGLQRLYLDGGTLPDGTVLPAGLQYLSIEGGALPDGTVLPAGLQYLFLDGGALPSGTVLPDTCVVYQ